MSAPFRRPVRDVLLELYPQFTRHFGLPPRELRLMTPREIRRYIAYHREVERG